MSYKLSGINPLAYMGVEPYTPPLLIVRPQSPTINDINFNLGSFWLNSITYELYNLTSVSQGVAAWIPMAYMNVATRAPLDTDWNYPIGSFWFNTSTDYLYILASVTDTNPPVATWIKLATGTVGTSITGDSGGAVHFDADGNIDLTGDTSGLTVVGTPLANTLSLEWPTPPETLQVLAGVTSESPKFLTLTSVGETLDITQTATTINFESTGGGNVGIVTIDGDTGGPIDSDVDGNINLLNSIATGMQFVGVEADNTITLSYPTPGTNGQVLIAATSSTPLWRNLTSTDGSVTITNGANSINLASGGSYATNCSFYAYQASNSAQYPGTAGVSFYLGTGPALTVGFNNGSYLYAGGGTSGTPATFTAPATGLYQLSFVATIANISRSSNVFGNIQEMGCSIVNTTAGIYYHGETQIAWNVYIGTVGQNAYSMSQSCLIPLSSGDVVEFLVSFAGGTVSWPFNIFGGFSSPVRSTYITGYRVA